MKRRQYNRKKKHGRFASGLEKDIWDKVARMKNKKFNIAYESELIKYFTVHNYKPDMILTFPGGKKIYIEVKGYLRYEDQVKMKAVKNANPELDIRLVFPETGRVGGSKMTPLQWCEKYGFPCTMTGKIPREWMKNSSSERTGKSVGYVRRSKSLATSTKTDDNPTVLDPTVSPA